MPIADTLPATLRLGPVHLTVQDLETTVAWYERSLGLLVMDRETNTVRLGDGADTLLVVHSDADARPAGERNAGLFHFCLLYATRDELARALFRIQVTNTPLTNIRDRGTHEAIYLPDPDGNNIELAWDRPRELWPEDPYGHEPTPLDASELIATIAGETLTPTVAKDMNVGHIHLCVGDLGQAVNFYRDGLGLELKYSVGWGVFFSVGGYHHQLAANLRRGTGLGPQTPHTIGLEHWTIELGEADDVDRARARLVAAGQRVDTVENGFIVKDPWDISIHVVR